MILKKVPYFKGLFFCLIFIRRLAGLKDMIAITNCKFFRGENDDHCTWAAGSGSDRLPAGPGDSPYQHRLEGSRYVTPEGTISGSNITLLDAVRNCVNECDIPLSRALEMASALPAKVIGVQDKTGELHIGKAASLLLLSDELSLKKVFINGCNISA